ncbi:MAG: discoidin domain-containing protein [Magnetococcales bacterium]|nr:discoidin domain-containing protein [Magnetococcales bacterium]
MTTSSRCGKCRCAPRWGGADLCNGGTPSASHATGDAYKLFDNNSSNYWITGSIALGVDSWIQYDFGAGNGAALGELWFMPNSPGQYPKDFKLQWSDDNATWTDRASWLGVTSWTAGIEKAFALPAEGLVRAQAQRSLPYGMSLDRQRATAFDLGLFVHAPWSQPFALGVARQTSRPYAMTLHQWVRQPFDHPLEKQITQLHAMILETSHGEIWRNGLVSGLRQPLHDTLERGRRSRWSLLLPVAGDHGQPRADTGSVVVWNRRRFDLLTRDPVCAARIAHWDLLTVVTPILPVWPTISANGQPLELIHATLAMSADSPHWVARLTVAREVDFARLRLEEPLLLSWGGERFSMLVAQKSVLRQRHDGLERIVTGISTGVRHEFPRALPVTRVWHLPVWARDAVEEVLGEAVSWELPNWRLPAGRLEVTNAAPLAVAGMVVGALGGVVRSRPDGLLRLRRRFPRAAPFWGQGAPDHLVTDGTDLLASREEGRFGKLFNRITVEEAVPAGQAPGVWLEVDGDPEGGNRGKSRFSPGDTVHLLTLATPGVALTGLTASTGTFLSSQPVTRRVHEELLFHRTHRAVLSRPVLRIDAVTWLGNDLGPLTLEKDGRTVSAAAVGVAVARVTCVLSVCAGHAFRVPDTQSGLDAFPAMVAATGLPAQVAARSLTLQRGDGRRPGAPVSSPLLTDPVALQARGEAELDLGESMGIVGLTLLHRPGLEPGQLVEVLDGMEGASCRGVVTSVTHELTATGAVTRLELVKRL